MDALFYKQNKTIKTMNVHSLKYITHGSWFTICITITASRHNEQAKEKTFFKKTFDAKICTL